MNTVSVLGRINKDAVSTLISENGGETPLVSFVVMDMGLPYTKGEPLFIEVNFMREAAMTLLPYLKQGKEVAVRGILRSKSYRTRSGEKKQKFYILAEYIMLTGQRHRKEDLSL